jgi:DNA-binding NtrC family response regulator/HAMP domain-containing protein
MVSANYGDAEKMQLRFRFQSLRSKLLLAIFTMVVGSGLLISYLVTYRYSENMFDAMIAQGEHLSHWIALEATDKILTSDVIALQKLLTSHQENNPNIAYLYVIRDGRVLAHTFPNGFPLDLLNSDNQQSSQKGFYRRIASTSDDHFLDFVRLIFSGNAGILHLGLSEKPFRNQIQVLWREMAIITIVILIVALAVSFWFIKRFTGPLIRLSEAAENIDAGNLDIKAESVGRDEVGKLTSSFHRMLERIRNHTSKLEKNAQELDRAHSQMRSSFDIIQKIGTQVNLGDVCSYLTNKFREMVPCSRFAFLVFNSGGETLFVISDGRLNLYAREAFESALPTFSGLKTKQFLPADSFDKMHLPPSFDTAARLAVFPFQHETRTLGVLLIACPDDCRCDQSELQVIDLILNQTAGAIRRATNHEEEFRSFQKRNDGASEFNGLVGRDPKMQMIYKLIEDIGPTDAIVLIQGESGTGKELVAQAIHAKSLRKDKPFVVINCSAYPATLLESELFGHEKGAFTGAVRRKTGRFEQAHCGTVFMDEIGEISPTAQIKLLRVLQTQQFERLGGEQTLSVDLRIISATNKNLLQEVKAGRFREDLYYRLNVIPINLPSLRERLNDIPLQARHFLRRFADEQGKVVQDFSSEAMRQLLEFPWPGNVRELENSIEHAVVLAKGRRIEITDLPAAIRHTNPEARKRRSRKFTDSEVELLREVLEECSWNKKEAARSLGISRSTLYNKIRKYRLTSPTIH